MENTANKLKKIAEGSELVGSSFSFKNRHILYNWEKSPESTPDRELVRYHFIASGDRFIEEKIESILNNFHEKSVVNYPFEEKHRMEGKSGKNSFPYLFLSYDTQYSPQLLSFKGVSNNIRRDKNLREREKLSIEDYVYRLYE